MKEIETKILEFDEQALRNGLKAANAEYKGKFLLRRVVFFITDENSNQDEFVRVRTDGKKTTMTWKFRSGTKELSNTEEIETEVTDFDKTVEIISKIWHGKKPIYQENKVEKWNYKDVEIAILTWPLIPPYLEIEGRTEDAVRDTIKELNIKGEDIGNTNLVAIFNRYGHHGKDWGELRF